MRKLTKQRPTYTNAWLIKVERYHGPFIRKHKNAISAVIEICEMLGVYYLYNKFEVMEIKCRTSVL